MPAAHGPLHPQTLVGQVHRHTPPVQARRHVSVERGAQYRVDVIPGAPTTLLYGHIDVALLVEHLSCRDLMALAALLPEPVRRTLAAGIAAADMDAVR